MADHIWYFARGEEEKGPFTEPQMRALAVAGKLRDSDLVWKEGMPDWIVAADVPDLLSHEQATNGRDSSNGQDSAPSGMSVVAAAPRARRVARRSNEDSQQHILRTVGRILAAIGFFGVLISKGCDGLSQRYVRRLEARRDWATRDFEARWTQKLAPIETQLTAASATGDNQTRILQLETQKNQIIGDREKQRRNLEQTDWRDFNDSARQAEMTHRMSGFWREIAFFIGTFAFTGGLLALSLNGDGPERWMCLIILAILAFSLYVGGSSWGSG